MWYLIVFFISMVPIVEIRGAVPVAVANDIVRISLVIGIVPILFSWGFTEFSIFPILIPFLFAYI